MTLSKYSKYQIEQSMIDLEYVLIIVLHESKCVFSQSCFKLTDIVVCIHRTGTTTPLIGKPNIFLSALLNATRSLLNVDFL